MKSLYGGKMSAYLIVLTREFISQKSKMRLAQTPTALIQYCKIYYLREEIDIRFF